LIETCTRRDDDTRTTVALDLHQQRQSFSRNFRIGQNVFYRDKLGFRQEKRVWPPVQQTLVKQFLRMNAGAEDPDRGISSVPVIGWTPMAHVRDYGGQKRLCRLYDVRKLYRPLSLSYRVKLARDRFARCDTFQELYADGFFHDKLSQKSR
jgi:hypothetical protein